MDVPNSPNWTPPISLKELLNEICEIPKFVCDESAHGPLGSTLKGCERFDSCLLLVGPEGGWDERDRGLLAEAGATSMKLGPRILRAETAAVTALSVLQYELGDLGH